jgi:putative flippase GtrA
MVFENRLARYALTGGSAAIIDVGGFSLLASSGVQIVPAATCSFLAATVVNFLLTSRWVFGQQATVKRYALFLPGTLFSLLVNVAITSVCAIELGFPRGISKVVAVGLTFLLSHWINARFVFGNSVRTKFD